MSEDHTNKYFKYAVLIVLVIYMYGAMTLKYVAGAKSLMEVLAMTFSGNKDAWEDKMGFIKPYWLGIFVFGFLSIIFSLGNIENSKGLQVVSVCMRFLSIILLILTSIVAIIKFGPTPMAEIEWFNFSEISDLFGNTIFIFILHHSVSGIVYPIRPQEKVKPMFMTSFSMGAGILVLEGFLAALAFGKEEYKDKAVGDFPCEIQELYNENFLKVPVVA